MAQLDGNAT
jgi:hypothetical protein